jgi:hypothetical protein
MKDSHKKSGTNSHSSSGADHSFHGMEADSRALKISGFSFQLYRWKNHVRMGLRIKPPQLITMEKNNIKDSE